MKRFIAAILGLALLPNTRQAASHTKHSKEACDATYSRLRQEIEAIDKDHLQRCFYDETCSQEEKCDWYITENDYFRNLSTVISSCNRVPEQEKELARYSSAVAGTDKLVERCTTGDLAGGNTAPLTKEARARRIKAAVQHAKAGGHGSGVRSTGHSAAHSSARKK